LQYCKKLQINSYITAQDIVGGNTRLNTLFAAQVFNAHHGLKLQELKKPEPIPEPVETDETREIKVFKNWINSMGLEDVYVNWLIEDLKDGRILLKIIERFRPGIVTWHGKYSDKVQYYTWVSNCVYVIELLKDNFKQVKIVNVGGKDIADGKTTLVLGVVWQLCKLYWIERTGEISETELIEWANNRVPQEHRIKSFKDKSIADCMFLLKII
jgi:plastin-1